MSSRNWADSPRANSPSRVPQPPPQAASAAANVAGGAPRSRRTSASSYSQRPARLRYSASNGSISVAAGTTTNNNTPIHAAIAGTAAGTAAAASAAHHGHPYSHYDDSDVESLFLAPPGVGALAASGAFAASHHPPAAANGTPPSTETPAAAYASTPSTPAAPPASYNNFSLAGAALPVSSPAAPNRTPGNYDSLLSGTLNRSAVYSAATVHAAPKRPPYIRQISGFSETFNSPSIYPVSPLLGPNTPSFSSLDDQVSVSNLNLQPLLPKRGKLKPKMKSYWAYYIPALEWIPRYKKKYLLGDISAGLTIASFQIPVSMSYATSLAHVPIVCGLYGLVIPPLVYGLMGSTPHMVVGPEAALSLVVGQAVSQFGTAAHKVPAATVSGIMSGAAGGVLLCAGLLRFGFLESVLSRALLRGFISAVGFVMVIDQLPAELGIAHLLNTEIGAHATTWEKLVFISTHFHKTHALTALVAFTAMFVIISFRLFKAKVSHTFKKIIFVPEILIVVIASTVLTDFFNWDLQGLTVVGEIQPGSVHVHFPITPGNWHVFKQTFSASFVCAVLGFFESTIASKSLGAATNTSVSTNRELVALGVTNFVGSLFNALPSFGGYGRSKINMLSGARTNLASFVLALVTILSIMFAMPYFYYLPKCVLSAVISVIGLSLIEEAPNDIMFYWRIGGYEDLFTMYLTLICTVFWSVETGIALGVGFSLVRVIRHATRSRIQILGRIPGTNQFENADSLPPERMEEIEGCFIVKIPEPLTFANTGDLRNRLRRLEVYGSMRVHPSFPRIRQEEMTRYVIFDLHGMTECDASAMQILLEIVSSYTVDRGIPVLFARVPNKKRGRRMFELSGIGDLVTKPAQGEYFESIEDALRFIDSKCNHGRC